MISQTIADFTTLAIASGGWMEMDRVYLQNRILGMIGETDFEKVEVRQPSKTPMQLVDELVATAKQNQVIGTSFSDQEICEAQLMDFLTPPPSVVNAFFAQFYAKDPKKATDYFYNLCKNNHSVKTQKIEKNITFPAKTQYGTLEIAINLSKNEKNVAATSYPKCQLCMETEGYKGNSNFPAQTSHRIIRMNLNGESWGLQYVSDAYYNEHCIIASEEHCPMKITKRTFERLLDIAEVLPHYFVGSDADLPNVGSIALSHEHYQGGQHHFALENAAVDRFFSLTEFPAITAGVLKWPLSVIRLQGKNKVDITQAANSIMSKWSVYSDEKLAISAYSVDGTPHHTVSSIARKINDGFEMDIILRDNNISAENPEGIFHPHKDIQHIQKGNITLIEAMGLATLPQRLDSELKEVAKYLLDDENDIAAYHKQWADRIKAKHHLTKVTVKEIIENEIAQKFVRALEDTGVFKQDIQGQAGLDQFIAACNIKDENNS